MDLLFVMDQIIGKYVMMDVIFVIYGDECDIYVTSHVYIDRM